MSELLRYLKPVVDYRLWQRVLVGNAVAHEVECCVACVGLIVAVLLVAALEFGTHGLRALLDAGAIGKDLERKGQRRLDVVNVEVWIVFSALSEAADGSLLGDRREKLRGITLGVAEPRQEPHAREEAKKQNAHDDICAGASIKGLVNQVGVDLEVLAFVVAVRQLVHVEIFR